MSKENSLIDIILNAGLAVVVHRPDLQCHRTSRPFNTSCRGVHEGHILQESIAGKELLQRIMETINRTVEMIKLITKQQVLNLCLYFAVLFVTKFSFRLYVRIVKFSITAKYVHHNFRTSVMAGTYVDTVGHPIYKVVQI